MAKVQSYIYNVLCDRCGWKFKNTEVRKDWQNYYVCKTCYEPRHPSDFYTTVNDVHILPFTRPDNNGVDVSPSSAAQNPLNRQAKADIGIAGNATLGFDIGLP